MRWKISHILSRYHITHLANFMIVILEHRISPPHIHRHLRNLPRNTAIRRPNMLVDIARASGLGRTIFGLIGGEAIDIEDGDIPVPSPTEMQGGGRTDGSCSSDYQDPVSAKCQVSSAQSRETSKAYLESCVSGVVGPIAMTGVDYTGYRGRGSERKAIMLRICNAIPEMKHA